MSAEPEEAPEEAPVEAPVEDPEEVPGITTTSPATGATLHAATVLKPAPATPL